MSTTQIQRRRGTEAQCDAVTPAEGEIIVDTTNDRLRVGDGATLGGIELPNASDLQRGSFNTVSASGTNTITVTLDPVPASYFSNMTIVFKAANTNTGATTLNVNSLGAKNIYKVSGGALGALGAGDITAGAYYTVRYDGTQFVLEGSAGGVSSVTAADASLTISPTTGAVVAGINTNNATGVGSIAMLYYTGSSLSNGSTSASSLFYVSFALGTGSAVTAPAAGTYAVTGTWRNISGRTIGSAAGTPIGMFIRTA